MKRLHDPSELKRIFHFHILDPKGLLSQCTEQRHWQFRSIHCDFKCTNVYLLNFFYVKVYRINLLMLFILTNPILLKIKNFVKSSFEIRGQFKFS